MSRILLRGGRVLPMAGMAAEIPADVLIEGDRIAAVGPALAVGDAETIDAAGCLVLPGLAPRLGATVRVVQGEQPPARVDDLLEPLVPHRDAHRELALVHRVRRPA